MNNSTSVSLQETDWLVIEQLASRQFVHSRKIGLRFSDEAETDIETVTAHLQATMPGVKFDVSSAVCAALHAWRASGDPVYFVTVSALARDALAWYARKLSPKVLTGEVSTYSPEAISG
jgi:hypothetical protein